jgi:hypothetical protein
MSRSGWRALAGASAALLLPPLALRALLARRWRWRWRWRAAPPRVWWLRQWRQQQRGSSWQQQQQDHNGGGAGWPTTATDADGVDALQQGGMAEREPGSGSGSGSGSGRSSTWQSRGQQGRHASADVSSPAAIQGVGGTAAALPPVINTTAVPNDHRTADNWRAGPVNLLTSYELTLGHPPQQQAQVQLQPALDVASMAVPPRPRAPAAPPWGRSE